MKKKTKICIILSFIFIFSSIFSFAKLNEFYFNQLLCTIQQKKMQIDYYLFNEATQQEIQIAKENFQKSGYGNLGYKFYIISILKNKYFISFAISLLFFIISLLCLFFLKGKDFENQKEAIYAQLYSSKQIKTNDKKTNKILYKIQENKQEKTQLIESYESNWKEFIEENENIAHQIKACLSIIMISADMIDEKLDHPDNKTNEIIQQCERTNKLLSMFLKKQKNVYHFTIASIEKTIMRSIKNVIPFAKQKNIQIELIETNSIMFAHDVFWLEEVIETILRNAATYAYENTVIQIRNYVHENKRVIIEIEDQGKNITFDEINEVFIRYVNSDVKREHFGIGLHMAKKIITDHFGTIRVENKTNGVVFIIELPFLELETLNYEM
ncbi:MAG: sensor histidine kinase [Traorella sp.]